MLRKIVNIDEEKCNGCGLCVPSCAEGAIQVIDGKARLISEVYCDGLGACLGECPQDAISIEEREADPFDEGAVETHLSKQEIGAGRTRPSHDSELRACPGSAVQMFTPNNSAISREKQQEVEAIPSALTNWPVQLTLAPVNAPYFKGAKLLLAGDCVPFAMADFHQRFLNNRTLLVGCPKLDNTDLYRRKLAQILLQNDVKSVEVLYMEVPCCFGLVHLARVALEEAGKDLPLAITKINVRGQVLETQVLGLTT